LLNKLASNENAAFSRNRVWTTASAALDSIVSRVATTIVQSLRAGPSIPPPSVNCG
jgi:hypothetical protein